MTAAAAAAAAGGRRNTGSGSDTEAAAAAGAVHRGGGRGGMGDTDLGFDPGVGIWTHGLACLDQLGVLRGLEAEGRCDARQPTSYLLQVQRT